MSMKNNEMIDISVTKKTQRIARVPDKTRKKVKAFLNEGAFH
jgi:translation initiation factor IF-1